MRSHPVAERPREQVAGEQRAEQRERAGDEHALADERRRGVDVLQRRRIDRDVEDAGLLRPGGVSHSGSAASATRPTLPASVPRATRRVRAASRATANCRSPISRWAVESEAK